MKTSMVVVVALAAAFALSACNGAERPFFLPHNGGGSGDTCQPNTNVLCP